MYTSSICEDPVIAVKRSATCGVWPVSRPLTMPCTADNVSICADGAQFGLSRTGPIGTATGPRSGSL